MMFKNINLEDLMQIKEQDKYFNKLNYNDKKAYLKYYSIYKKWFTIFLIDYLKLKEYDDMLVKINGFNIINIDNMDFYQYYASDILKFFFLRNDLYMDRLNKEDLEFINNHNNDEYNLETKEFVRRTYKKLIFNNLNGKETKCKVFYGPNNSSYLAYNDALIIGVRLGRFKYKIINKDFSQHDQLLRDFYDLIIEMQKEYSNIISNDVSIIRYNDFSSIKRIV